MKKFALALMASAAMVLGFGIVANAYPPGAGTTTTSASTVSSGGTVTVKTTCQPGETVTFTLVGDTKTATCGAAGTAASLFSLASAGSASATLTVPTTPGVYTGTVTGSATGSLGTFSVTVTAAATPVTPGTQLPATGSNSASTMTIIALGLFAVGAGLFGVSQMRRRTAA